VTKAPVDDFDDDGFDLDDTDEGILKENLITFENKLLLSQKDSHVLTTNKNFHN